MSLHTHKPNQTAVCLSAITNKPITKPNSDQILLLASSKFPLFVCLGLFCLHILYSDRWLVGYWRGISLSEGIYDVQYNSRHSQTKQTTTNWYQLDCCWLVSDRWTPTNWSLRVFSDRWRLFCSQSDSDIHYSIHKSDHSCGSYSMRYTYLIMNEDVPASSIVIYVLIYPMCKIILPY